MEYHGDEDMRAEPTERELELALEMYVASFSSNEYALEKRRDRERKLVEEMLVKHLTGSDMVADYAMEDAE